MDETTVADVHGTPPVPSDIKVCFRFVPRPGWLPYDVEVLWATRVGPDLARVNNVPFLQDGVAQGDVIRFWADPSGVMWSLERVEESGNCTIRVLPVLNGPMGGSASAVHRALSEFNLGGEVFSEQLPLVAFNVPAGSDFRAIKAALIRGQENGSWHFEVGCATEEWRRA